MKRLLPLLLIILILPSIAYAEEMDISLSGADEYLAGRSYDLELTVKNNGPAATFKFSILGVPSNWMNTDVNKVVLGTGESETIEILFSPPKDARPSLYEYYFTFQRMSDSEFFQLKALPNVRQVSDAIFTSVAKSCELCVDTIKIEGLVENTGTRDMDLVLELSLGNDKVKTDAGYLQPSETADIYESFSLADFSPGEYYIESVLKDRSGSIIFTNMHTFRVPSVENIEYESAVSTNLIGRFSTLRATNTGNTDSVASFTSHADDSWYVIFSGPEPDKKESGNYTWLVSIGAKQSAEVVYHELYWPVFAGLLFLIAVGVYVYTRNFSTTIKKTLKSRGHVKKDSELSVSLHIDNNARELKNVIVKDFVPGNFSIVGKFETVKPIIKKADSGTELMWTIPIMMPHEHRLLNYRIKSKQDVEKTVHLPSAKMKAKHSRGTTYKQSIRPVIHGSKENAPDRVSVQIDK